MKGVHRGLFRNVDWSTERVFRQTLARAGELGLPVVELPAWYDVDDGDSLRLLIGELFEDRRFRPSSCMSAAATCTRAYLAERLAVSDLRLRLRGAGPQAAASGKPAR
jgi:hypothetical protein